jgi:hypothetical protein
VQLRLRDAVGSHYRLAQFVNPADDEVLDAQRLQ